ncbi:MAG: alkaline phosphatase [Halioglobus sp.]|nr:alkaline phosphatase [Halioglobus sp.]
MWWHVIYMSPNRTVQMIRAVTYLLLSSLACFVSAEDDLGPRQVILVIGDGMDDQQITIARNYLAGASGQLLLDRMPLRASVQVLAVEDKEQGAPVYVSDSANTATAMATGTITSRGRIATAPGTDKDITTIVELATAAGLRSGLVTTASVTDATAAAFATHVSSRRCEDPDHMQDVTVYGFNIADCSEDLKANGGPGSVAEQLAESALDVLLGGGRRRFAPIVEGGTISVEELADQNGFHLVTNTAELLSAKPNGKLLGLFAPGNLPVRLQGENKRIAEDPKRSWLNHLHPYLGSVQLPEPMGCEPNPDFEGTPTLKQMTETALAHLSHNNDSGFFLMIESASIDKQAHERKPCGSIGEMAQLEAALGSILEFAARQPRTLVVVTADHAQVAQLIPDQSLFEKYPIPAATPGKLARIKTPEGAHMAVNFATTNFMMEEHAGTAVPLFSNEEGLGRIPPFLQQPQLFQIMRTYLGI